MPVIRIEKQKNYTIMSNYHLQDRNISLKAKGLLSYMLSLPDYWEYSINGLASICKEGPDCIRSTVQELEEAGYITRSRQRLENGQLGGIEYVVRERPAESQYENKPISENPTQEEATVENPRQINNVPKKERNEKIPPLSPRGEKNQKNIVVIPSQEKTGFSDQMQSAFEDWVEYKSVEKKYKYKEIGLRNLILEIKNNIQTYGEQIVIRAIQRTISNGWQGIAWNCCQQIKEEIKQKRKEENAIPF